MKSGKKPTDGFLATALLICLSAVTATSIWFDESLGATVVSIVDDISDGGPNAAAANKATQKYYGELLAGEQEVESGPQMMAGDDDPDVPTSRTETIQRSGATNNHTGNFLPWELVPNASVVFKGMPLVVNEYGQRDRSGYTKSKPEGTFRIALVGGSNTMGSGVEEEKTFGSLIEERLNRDLAGREGAYDHYEVINFAVGGYHMPEALYVVETKVGEFDPALILVNATDKDLSIQHERLARRVFKKDRLQFRFLKDIVKEAGIDSSSDGDPLDRMVRKLYPYQEEILMDCMDGLSRYARRNGVEIAIFLLRREGGPRIEPDLQRTLEVLQKGDLKVLPLFDAYEGVGKMELWLIPHENPDLGDPHPNLEGHHRIADDLYDKLLADETLGPMLRGSKTTPGGSKAAPRTKPERRPRRSRSR